MAEPTVICPNCKTETKLNESLAKKEVAVTWCKNASDHAREHGGKPWKYVLIPHTAIAENMTLEGLAKQFAHL